MSIQILFVRRWEKVRNLGVPPVPAVHITYGSSTNNAPAISVACSITKLGGGGVTETKRAHLAKGHYLCEGAGSNDKVAPWLQRVAVPLGGHPTCLTQGVIPSKYKDDFYHRTMIDSLCCHLKDGRTGVLEMLVVPFASGGV